MAQIKMSVNLSSAAFVLSHTWKGQSVVVPGQDQNTMPARPLNGDTPQQGFNIPQLYYAENVIPTAEGYRSFVYQYMIKPVDEAGLYFVKTLYCFDGDSNKAILGITSDRRLWIASPGTLGDWEELVLPVGFEWDVLTDTVTVATVVGYFGFCIEGKGIYVLDIATRVVTKATIIGLDDTLIKGITSAASLLIAYDNNTVYWSSSTNPEDFTPSLITGAGSSKPEALKGRIQLCKEIQGGFVIYSDTVMIGAEYTGNKSHPWTYRTLVGGAGIRHPDAVGFDVNLTTHFAWTSSGIVEVTLKQAAVRFPEITDYVASGLEDVTASFDGYPVSNFTKYVREVRISYVASRYLCISIGLLVGAYNTEFIPQPYLTHAFLYDTQYQRWGKLNCAHTQINEFPFAEGASDPPPPPGEVFF